MKTIRSAVCLTATLLLMANASDVRASDGHAQNASERSAMLERVYQMRMAIERDRARAEGEARSNVRLAGSVSGQSSQSAPTVTAMRAETYQHLSRFEQNFRCLDVDVDNSSGNTVVICGDNSGDIDGSNVNAGRDIVIPSGRH